MRVFIEEQRFTQWWIFGSLGFIFTGLFLSLLLDSSDPEKNTALLIGLGIIILVFMLFLILRLHTRIDNSGITTYFGPFPLSRKHFSWNKIEKCYIRKYSAKTEYGGRGLRVLQNKKAYSIKGKDGIQIVTKEKKHFLIGTQKSLEARSVVKYYTNKTERV